MDESERRLPCPVCLDVELTPRNAAPGHALMLDRCERCGGIWFDAGEVEHLRSVQSPAVWRKVMLSDDAYSMSCHSCRGAMDRNVADCPACGWHNVLDCPVCARTMKRWRVEGLMLDWCLDCRGVWFDRIELAEIWNLKGNALGAADAGGPAPGRRSRAGGATDIADAATIVGVEAADFLLWNPDLVAGGVEAAGRGVSGVGSVASEAASAAPAALGAAAEVAGDVADGVFGAIADIIGGLFG